MSDDLESLTPAQREAVEHVDGPLLILAGPGSGKTRVVTHRVARLLQRGVRAEQILALTFTNKAADEMRGRVERLAHGEPVWMGTFHRFCARLLRQHAPLVGLAENYTIYDESDALQTLRRAIDSLGLELVRFTPDRIREGISWAENNLITAAEYQPARSGHALGQIVAEVYPAYQAQLLTCNAVDFDDLLLHLAVLLRENSELRAALDEQYRYILVDEYQDTNLAQYTIVRALSIDYPNLAVTGDPDQSIYGWRGANLNNILNFEQDFPNVRVVRLERNYRSTKRILRVADQLIGHNIRRKAKSLFTENDDGRPVRLAAYADQRVEAAAIAQRIAEALREGDRAARDFAIFYRMNALSRVIESALRQRGIPYQMINGVEFFQRKEIKDVLAYLQLLNNPRDGAAFLRVINNPPRAIGKTSIGRLEEYAQERRTPLLEAARAAVRVPGLAKRAAVAIEKFVALIDRLGRMAHVPLETIVSEVLKQSGYRQQLEQSDNEQDAQRLANIEELLTAAREFDERHPGGGRLEEFLEEACLVNDVDAWETDQDRVTMMTLHASKGLEFPVVFIIALEEGLLPHERCRDSINQLEEERRLLFVGITRAQEELELSRSSYRAFRGREAMTVPSQFLMELPREEMELVDEGESADGIDFDVEQLMAAEQELHAAPSPPQAPAVAPVITAAELANPPAVDDDLPRDPLQEGMLVRHPEYGLGKVMAISGDGARQTATVAFVSVAGLKKFVVDKSPLRPARRQTQSVNSANSRE